MANAKITELTELTSVATDDVLPIVDVSESPDVTKKITVANLMVASVPAGAVSAYAGSSAPTGWLICNGVAVSQATYAALYAVIGVTYGNPGGGNFNLPDLRARVTVGVNTDGTLGSGATQRTNKALASVAGEENHVLITAELASHTHSVYAIGSGGGAGLSGTGSNNINPSVTTTSAGSDTAHINMQPYIALNYIIKT